MRDYNIFGNYGYLTDEDRKKPLVHRCDYLTFTGCLDLSGGVNITSSSSLTKKVSLNQYTSDVACFTAWWVRNVGKDLNGFSGLDTVKFEVVDCEIIQK